MEMPNTQIWLQRNLLTVLYTLYIISLLLMIATIACFCIYLFLSLSRIDGFNVAHKSYNREFSISILAFFGTANAMVIFRVFALNKFIIVLHIIIHFSVLTCLLLNVLVFGGAEDRDFFAMFQIPSFLLIASYILQSLLAFHLVIFRPGLTPVQRDKRAGAHSFMGLITFVMHLWNVLLHLQFMCSSHEHILEFNQTLHMKDMLPEPMIISIFIIVYTLAIIAILLTPYFEAEYRDVIVEMNQEAGERRKNEDKTEPLPIDSRNP